MLNSQAQIRFAKQKEASKKGDLSTIKKLAEEARNEMIRKGYVNAWPVYKWIEKEWYEKAIQEGVISYHSKEYGYQIVGYEKEIEITVGYRGRMPIREKKIILDISRFRDFERRYKEYRENKERQHQAINNEIKSIVQTEIK